MATTYPTTLDTFRTDYLGTERENVVDHATMHSNAFSAIQAVEKLLGTVSGQTTPGGANRVLNSTSTTASTWTTNPTVGSMTLNAGNLAFSTTGQRITGDFSNLTASSRVGIKSSTLNGNTLVNVIPNGNATTARVLVLNNSDVDTSPSFMELRIDATKSRLNSGFIGSGTSQPLALQVGGTDYLTIPTTGGVQVNSGNLGVNAAPSTNIGLLNTGTVTASSGVGRGMYVGTTLTANANGDSLYAIETQPAWSANGKTSLSLVGLNVDADSVAGATFNKYGIVIGAQTGANALNVGVDIAAPSGGTTNIGLRNAGTTQLTGNVGIGTAPLTNVLAEITGSATASGTLARTADIRGTLTAGANNDVLYGIDVTTTFALGGKTGVNNTGIFVEPVYSAGGTNIGIDIAAPSGAATNIGLRNAGTTQLTGNIGQGIVPQTQIGITTQTAQTGSGGYARGFYQADTLTAGANSDALTGLYLNPTFALGGKTGVTTTLVVLSGTYPAGTQNVGLNIGSVTGAATNIALVTGTGQVRFGDKVTVYNNVPTAGWGVQAIQAAGRVTAQTAANSGIATYTVGAADGSFIISGNVLVTASTTHSFSLECAYTDEGNTARVVTFNVSQLNGTLGTLITAAIGAGPYEAVPLQIRAKASTAITIRTNAGGTYTSVTYNAEGSIRQIA